MAFFYPRKQTVIIFIICIGLVLGTAYYTGLWDVTGSTAQTATVSGTIESLPNTAEAPLRIDETAFSDWRKQFADATDKAPTNAATPSDKGLTKTDILGRDLFSRFVELRQADLINQSDIVEQVAENLAVSHVNVQPTKIYSAGDIHTVSLSDTRTLESFSISVARAVEMYVVTKNESLIIQEYITTNNPGILKEIDPIITTYEKIISALLAIPTPQPLVNQHLGLINGYSSLKAAAEGLRAIDTDSIRGLSGVRVHIDGAASIIAALKGIHDTLKTYSVQFDFNQKVLNALLT